MNFDSLPDVLAHHAATLGDQPVYQYVPPRSTATIPLGYRALHDAACGIGAALQAQGLRGRNALLLYPPGLEFIEAFFGCLRGSVSTIPMYIPPRNVPDARLRAIAATVEIAAILTVKSREALAHSLAAELLPGQTCRVICTDDLPAADVAGATAADLPVDLDVPPLIQFTSGSTSRPKGVVVSHTNIMANQRMIQRAFRHRGGETVVSWLPFFHDMGLIGNIMQPLYIGGSSILMSPTDFLQNPHKWLQLISMHAADTSGAPNFAYDYCVARVTAEQADGLDLGSWAVAYNGSEMIRPTTMRRFCERFKENGFRPDAVLHCYGMAETTLYVAGGRAYPDGTLPAGEAPPDAIASVGRPDEESEVLIVDEEGIEQPEGRTGEIWVRGPHVAQGYVNNPQATEATFEARPGGCRFAPAYLRTGDLGYLRGGELHIVGRVKNLIVVNGKNYHGEEIEYFVARSDAHFLESGACIMQLNEGLSNNEIVFMQEIRKSAVEAAGADLERLEDKALQLSRQVLEQFNLPVHRFIYLRESRLPRTSSGKVDRARARDFALAETRPSLLEVQTR